MTAIDWINRYSKMPRKFEDNAGSMMKKVFPYLVNVTVGKRQVEIDEWLDDNVAYEEFVQVGGGFLFQDEIIAMQFKLTWR